MPPVITLTTDFGTQDSFVAAMKGVLLSRCSGVQLVDLCHDVPPQSIRAGALRLASACWYFPPGTVHLAVVEPGVGGRRRPIAVAVGGPAFVGPDNGLLSLAAEPDAPGWRGVEIANRSLWLPNPSSTFHGRDIFAPAAAHLACGRDLRELGPPIDRMVQISLPRVVERDGRLSGLVLDVDRFGNLITNVRPCELQGWAVEVTEIMGREIRGLSQGYDPSEELVGVVNSDGWLEIAAPGGSAAGLLGASADAPVAVRLRRLG
jgi:S-adenosylmethionine hydrolase